jgi:quercetin dioxygenase-like cupin family protein
MRRSFEADADLALTCPIYTVSCEILQRLVERGIYMPRNAVLGANIHEVQWTPAREATHIGNLEELPDEVLISVLSYDEETGYSTVLFKVPPGRITDQPEAHSVAQETLFLEGEARWGDLSMKPGTYVCFPPGVVHGPAESETGYVCYTTTYGKLDIQFVPENFKQGDIVPV